MREFLMQHGWWAIFAGAMVERDLTGLFAGVVAHAAPLNLTVTILSGVVGALVGDLACYTFGWWFGRTLGHKPFVARVSQKLSRVTGRFGPFAIVVCQFLWGFRTASMVFFGIHHTSVWRFIFFDLIGCVLLMTVLTCTGYFVSEGAEALLIRARHYELAALVLAALVLIVIFAYRRRRQSLGQHS